MPKATPLTRTWVKESCYLIFNPQFSEEGPQKGPTFTNARRSGLALYRTFPTADPRGITSIAGLQYTDGSLANHIIFLAPLL